ncbi:plasmid mobilization protein [Streptomyces niveus]|uniref:plasmid mobilization protein n=1 Tax=Streptomyces niveus TaxID=193462 RepID=UPI0036E70FBB
MTDEQNTPAHQPAGEDTNSASGGASWYESNTPVGSITLASPAPGVAGEGRRQGAPTGPDAAEGGLHPEEETTPACQPSCPHSVPAQRSARNRPRKTKRSKRAHLIASRFNDVEKAMLIAAAAACSMTPSGFLAHAALRAARDLDRTAAEVAGEREVIAELFALRRHLGQISNNINQVAKALNSGADVPHTRATVDAVSRAAQRVDAFTQHYLSAESRIR